MKDQSKSSHLITLIFTPTEYLQAPEIDASSIDREEMLKLFKDLLLTSSNASLNFGFSKDFIDLKGYSDLKKSTDTEAYYNFLGKTYDLLAESFANLNPNETGYIDSSELSNHLTKGNASHHPVIFPFIIQGTDKDVYEWMNAFSKHCLFRQDETLAENITATLPPAYSERIQGLFRYQYKQ